MPLNPNRVPSYSHRDPQFTTTLRRIQRGALRIAHLDEQQWGVVVMPGSGTAGLEAAVWTITRSVPLTPLFANTGGKFSARLFDLCFAHGGVGIGTEDVCYVQYETSRAERQQSGWKSRGITLVDAVSAFPYYPIPTDADVLVTVAGKQLGCHAGLVLIFFRRDPAILSLLRAASPPALTFLNLWSWIQYADERGQTPVTMPLRLCEELADVLLTFDPERERKRIDARAAAIDALDGQRGMKVRGVGPTRIVAGIEPELAAELGLYRAASFDAHQLFLWGATSDREFDDLYAALAD